MVLSDGLVKRSVVLPPLLQYPGDYSKSTQASEGGWHIPISLSSQATPTNDTWLVDGRRRWNEDDVSHTPQPDWLCLRR